MASALRSAEQNFLLLLRLATYRDDGLLVIGAIVEGIMALRVGHYSTTRPALDEAQVRREDEVRLPSGVAQGEEESRFCIAKNGHGLAGVKLGPGTAMDDARRKCRTARAPAIMYMLPCLVGGTSRPLLVNGPMPAVFSISSRRPCTPLALRSFPCV